MCCFDLLLISLESVRFTYIYIFIHKPCFVHKKVTKLLRLVCTRSAQSHSGSLARCRVDIQRFVSRDSRALSHTFFQKDQKSYPYAEGELHYFSKCEQILTFYSYASSCVRVDLSTAVRYPVCISIYIASHVFNKFKPISFKRAEKRIEKHTPPMYSQCIVCTLATLLDVFFATVVTCGLLTTATFLCQPSFNIFSLPTPTFSPSLSRSLADALYRLR